MKDSTPLEGAREGRSGFPLIGLPPGIVVPEVAFGTTVSLSLQHSRMRRMSEETDLASIVWRN